MSKPFAKIGVMFFGISLIGGILFVYVLTENVFTALIALCFFGLFFVLLPIYSYRIYKKIVNSINQEAEVQSDTLYLILGGIVIGSLPIYIAKTEKPEILLVALLISIPFYLGSGFFLLTFVQLHLTSRSKKVPIFTSSPEPKTITQSESTGNSFCANCGQVIDMNDTFCGHCGNKLP